MKYKKRYILVWVMEELIEAKCYLKATHYISTKTASYINYFLKSMILPESTLFGRRE